MFKDVQVPAGMLGTIFDGASDVLPENFAEIEVYIPTYMGSNEVYEVIDSLPNLRYVLLLSAGVDKALPHIRPGVTLCNARGVHDSSTAELTLALALASYRNLANYIRANQDCWSLREQEKTLYAANVAIVGAGSIGREVEKLFYAFGATCTLISRSGSDGSIRLVDAGDLLRASDIVVVVVPLTDATLNLVNAEFLAKLKDGALVINVARGEVVDTQALFEELSTQRISAALDVTNPEPLPTDHPLWQLENCVITPHVGGVTHSFMPKATSLIEGNLELIASGEDPKFIVVGTY